MFGFSGALVVVDSAESASFFGTINRSNSNGTIWGMRADIDAPLQFNILSGTLALMRVAVQTHKAVGSDGIEQIGFGQFNNAGLDHCITSDPGQLKTYWETKDPNDDHNDSTHLNGYVCGFIGNISGGTRTFNVRGNYDVNGNGLTCWYQLMNGTLKNQHCFTSSSPISAYFGYIGGEITKGTSPTAHCNGNTFITGNYGKPPSTNVEWQRTADEYLAPSVTWYSVNTPSGNTNDGGEWELGLPGVPSPFIFFDHCN